jgi:hypothetical protein
MQPGDAGIAVSPASLFTHAGHIDAAADGVEVARAAAEQVRLNSGAYGMVCAFMPAYLNGLSDGLMTGLDAALVSLRSTGANLRATAALYAEAEETAGRQVRAPLGDPDPGPRGFIDRTDLLDPTARG